MRILWLVSITLPQAARAFGLKDNIGGGWLQGQLEQIRNHCTLAVCAVNPAVRRICQTTVDGVEYILLPTGSDLEFRTVLFSWQPLLVHIWGSEYEAARTLFAECDPNRVLISIQGLMGECARHLTDGVPPALLHSNFAQRFVNHFVPGALLDLQQQEFDRLAQSETDLLKGALHVSGRTSWDRRKLRVLAPKAAYHPCNETLRAAFYTGSWQPHGGTPTLFLSQGNYPLKGLHRLLEALPAVLEKYPDLCLRIAGWPPLDRGALFRPVIRRMFPYQTYCQALQKKLGLTDHVRYTGPLDAEQMKQEYLQCSLSVLCSSVENSPNSLGEAMLLGVPCVAAAVGGVPDMVQDGTQALLYPPADTAALSRAILRILDDAPFAAQLGRRAQQRARITHDAEANGRAMMNIYAELLKES